MTARHADMSAERAALGSVLLHPRCLDEALDLGLRPEHMHHPAHRAVLAAFCAIAESRQAIDVVTVSGHLEAAGRLNTIGGFSFLSSLSNSVPSVTNLPSYVATVLEHAKRRRMVLALESALHRASGDGWDPDEALAAHLADLDAMQADSDGGDKPEDMSTIAPRVSEAIIERSRNPQDVVGLPSGLVDLDAMTAGFQPSDLVIIAARPAMGKSAIALNIIAHASRSDGARTLLVTLEMSRAQVAARLIGAEGRIDGGRIRTGRLREDDYEPLMSASEVVSSFGIRVDDRPGRTLAQIRAEARRMARTGLDLVVVDYLQLMGGRQGQSEYETITEASKGLKGLAKELHVPVIALSQLNRDVEKRADKRPTMADLRSSGQIEQDADLIMFLYRAEVYDANESPGVAEVLVRKQRNGRIGTVLAAWRGEHCRFDNLQRGVFR